MDVTQHKAIHLSLEKKQKISAINSIGNEFNSQVCADSINRINIQELADKWISFIIYIYIYLYIYIYIYRRFLREWKTYPLSNRTKRD